MESILITMKKIQRFDEITVFGYIDKFSMIWRKIRENRKV